MNRMKLFLVLLPAVMVMKVSAAEPDVESARMEYAKARLVGGGKVAEVRIDAGLQHPEAYRVQTEGGKSVIEGGGGGWRSVWSAGDAGGGFHSGRRGKARLRDSRDNLVPDAR